MNGFGAGDIADGSVGSLLQLLSGEAFNEGNAQPATQQTKVVPTLTPGSIGPSKSKTTPAPPTKKVATGDIWDEDDVMEVVDVEDPRPNPEYKMHYRQKVSSEDMYLQMNGKTPSLSHADEVVITIDLPDVVFKDIELNCTETTLDLRCPKFCFEHRKNVCEKCILADHSKCIVRSYLQWLQDSDYDPVCQICTRSLDEGELVRLSCLDLFHVECLNTVCQKLPEHTSPAGYLCPTCSTPILPADNVNSRIADLIRGAFEKSKWAQHIITRRVPPASSVPRIDPPLPGLPNSLSTSPTTLSPQTSIDSARPKPDYTEITVKSSVPTRVTDSGGIPAKKLNPKASQNGLRDGDADKYGKTTPALNVRFWGRVTPKRIVIYLVSFVSFIVLYTFFFSSGEE
ncbi:hypothetical protein HDV05_008413 [Chytridiales sp. JEL 0842]|nr:hypothetical protein HDV05_008413 [Chytridiales sp. JEL 0842]